jgi:hypothetical protein
VCKAGVSYAGADLKVAWFLAEQFGKVVGGSKREQVSRQLEPITWKAAQEGIKRDYEENYFVSGAADMAAYDPQCEFADPFVSFRGEFCICSYL